MRGISRIQHTITNDTQLESIYNWLQAVVNKHMPCTCPRVKIIAFLDIRKVV